MSLNKPDKQRQQQGAQVRTQQIIQQRSGPIPDPESLERYNSIQPGFADRIIQMAEKEQAERHAIDKAIIQNQHKQHKRDTDTYRISQVLALLSVLVVVALCVYCFMLGFANQGASIAVAVIIGLAGVFALGKYKPDSNNDKAE